MTLWALMASVLIVVLGLSAVLYKEVVVEPGEEIQIEYIRRILGKESPVFYSDGKTRLGVFFDQDHRQYVNYEEIPADFVNALVASEDNRFFSHYGFDPRGIIRAAIINLRAGKIVQGGSTLTQQTAKNLFKRNERSIKAKLKELLCALRLEYHYSKEQILEFYANQFYVAGNSLGLGMAARYYFDKQPSELMLLECAFIAGSVKRPNYYNPFTKKSEIAVEQAKKRAGDRGRYVLDRMLELKMIDEDVYRGALQNEIVFKKGKVGFDLDNVMEMVSEAVTTSEVLDALKNHDIDNVATSGIRLITSVDPILQQKTMYALRRQLSSLDVRLRGYEREVVQKELENLNYSGDTSLKEMAFMFGQVKSVQREPSFPFAVEVVLGPANIVGLIDNQGLERMVEARTKWEKNPWATTEKKDYLDLLNQVKEGDRVWVSVRRIEADGSIILDLERFPLIQGGALVIRDGMIKAMAGGVENRFFNRAISARRSMGSSFKPFVYAAALQLGWSAVDLLNNKRDVFVFQNQTYFPRPDHKSPYDQVSMDWAGVYSENVASVWLLYHLCDHLNLDQIHQIASHVDMAPRMVNGEKESYGTFKSRMRDEYGIVVNQDVLRQAAYDQAVANLETDFLFAGRQKEYERLKQLHYGLGFSSFVNDIDGNIQEGENKGELRKDEKEELVWQKAVLADNFLALEDLFKEMRLFIHMVEAPPQGLYQFGTDENVNRADLFYDRVKGQYSFSQRSKTTSDMTPVNTAQLREFIHEQNLDGKRKFWENVYLDSLVSVAAYRIVLEQLQRDSRRLEEKLPYSMDVLSMVRDFRVMLGLRYIVEFAKQAGIRSQMEPVLSLPLGSNVTTLFETVRMFEGLVTGKVVLAGEEGDEDQDLLAVLERIESEEGELLYQPARNRRNLVAPEVGVSIGHVLENVVKFGTGRYADTHVKISGFGKSSGQPLADISLRVPILGKTGTANRYTNAAFIGYLPGVSTERDAMVNNDGFAVGVYVGFDDNEVMRKGATKVTGAFGALPAWTEIVNGLLDENAYGDKLDPVDLSFNGLVLRWPENGHLNVSVDPKRGGMLGNPVTLVDDLDRNQPSVMTFGRLNEWGQLLPDRRLRPFWQ